MLIFSVANLTTFFEDQEYLGMNHITRLWLVEEGIDSVNNLEDFDKESIKQIAHNLQRATPNPKRSCSHCFRLEQRS